ncbi:NADH-quinone oxidoreductase subunit K [Zobellella denitrificans]|jgi:multicomponent Na+:H+ antiporter subunit C|uniref:NADH-ubiquinone oxidoreductase n=1 Tax=Zobellella denitrificans TaxID=347534 RepID=A0A291HSE7_9GAMM|nr:NADH-quinone oxidoreductase subunit K [Zobellella denitrificans]ATG74988.1 NADH-ubiquinone oxidoreductase [Zobellella denitrificans]
MIQVQLYVLAAVALCGIGLAGLLLCRHLLRRLMAFNLMGSGTFLLLVGLAQSDGVADPVPQALVLTGIVVALAASALALVLIRRWYHLSGHSGLDRGPDS